jgi:hypothetical protein
MLAPFRQPGLGFEIDKRKLRKYGTRFFKLTETGLKLKVIREKGLSAALEIKRRKEQLKRGQSPFFLRASNEKRGLSPF